MSKRICALPECERPHYGKGYCKLHWRRLTTHGSAEWTPPRQADTCEVAECGRQPLARNLCDRHYRKWRAYGDPTVDRRRTPNFCTIEGCDSHVKGHGLCGKHYLRWRAHGDPAWQAPRFDSCTVPDCQKDPRSPTSGLCEAHYMRLRRNGTLEAGQCTICQSPLPPESPFGRQFCDSCNLDRRRARGRDEFHRRRVAMLAGPAERISSLEIYERDGWRCGLCRKKVNPKLSWPHPQSASLDHIVPIAHGGHHVRTNVHLAHLTCNLSKQHRGGGEQLMLIG